MNVNSPLVIAAAAVPVLLVLAVVYLVSKGGEVIDRGRADIDDQPAEDDPGWERHCREAVNLANSWGAIDDLQLRRELRKHNHPTTN